MKTNNPFLSTDDTDGHRCQSAEGFYLCKSVPSVDNLVFSPLAAQPRYGIRDPKIILPIMGKISQTRSLPFPFPYPGDGSRKQQPRRNGEETLVETHGTCPVEQGILTARAIRGCHNATRHSVTLTWSIDKISLHPQKPARAEGRRPAARRGEASPFGNYACESCFSCKMSPFLSSLASLVSPSSPPFRLRLRRPGIWLRASATVRHLGFRNLGF